MDWQETWAPASMCGFRKNHSTLDAFMRTALLVEKAFLDGTPLHGAMLDLQKCFDSVREDGTG